MARLGNFHTTPVHRGHSLVATGKAFPQYGFGRDVPVARDHWQGN